MALWNVLQAESRWIIVESDSLVKQEILKKIVRHSIFDTIVYYGWHGKAVVVDRDVETFIQWKSFLERLEELWDERIGENVLIILDEPPEVWAHHYIPNVLGKWILYAHKYKSSVILLCNRFLEETPILLRQGARIFAKEKDRTEVNQYFAGKTLVWETYDNNDIMMLYQE